MIKIQIITLFPEVVEPYLGASMLWKASKEGLVEYSCINLREFGIGSRKTVDDTPYGGGDGMLLKPEPLVAAIEYAIEQNREYRSKNIEDGLQKPIVILPTPRGKTYKQSDAKRIAAGGRDLIIICPRYEGYDERVTGWVDEQYSVGNYVLTGGELPALTIVDSIVRLIPGVLGGAQSAEIESFQQDDENIEFPQYTRPAEFRGLPVPGVLLNGHHAEIDKWRKSV
jgi:tRNA (guanine37-N1)-methyltransferase